MIKPVWEPKYTKSYKRRDTGLEEGKRPNVFEKTMIMGRGERRQKSINVLFRGVVFEKYVAAVQEVTRKL